MYVSIYLSIYLVYVSIYLSIYLVSIYLCIYVCIYVSIYLSIYLECYVVYLSIYLCYLCIYVSSLSIYLSVYLYLCIYHMYLSICVCMYLSVYLSICLSIYLSLSISLSLYLFVCLPDFLNLSIWQVWKRSNSARLPQFLNLTTSETQRSCETPQFSTWQHQTKQFCETSFKNGKVSAELTASYQCVLRFLHSICLKCRACHAPVIRKNHLSKPEDLMLQNATPLRKSAPWPPNISGEHVSCTAHCACQAKCIFADPLQMSHACHRFWTCYKTVTFCSLLTRCTIPCACRAKRHLSVQKWSETVSF